MQVRKPVSLRMKRQSTQECGTGVRAAAGSTVPTATPAKSPVKRNAPRVRESLRFPDGVKGVERCDVRRIGVRSRRISLGMGLSKMSGVARTESEGSAVDAKASIATNGRVLGFLLGGF